MNKYYFGRGNRNNISVELMPGYYFKIGVSNVKTGKDIATAVFDRGELYRLHQFFEQLWIGYGSGEEEPLLPPLNMEEYEKI